MDPRNKRYTNLTASPSPTRTSACFSFRTRTRPARLGVCCKREEKKNNILSISVCYLYMYATDSSVDKSP